MRAQLSNIRIVETKGISPGSYLARPSSLQKRANSFQEAS